MQMQLPGCWATDKRVIPGNNRHKVPVRSPSTLPISKSQAGDLKARLSSVFWPHIFGSKGVFHIVGPNRVLNLGWIPTFKKSWDFTYNYGFLVSQYLASYTHGTTWLECKEVKFLQWAGVSSFTTIPITEPNQLHLSSCMLAMWSVQLLLAWKFVTLTYIRS